MPVFSILSAVWRFRKLIAVASLFLALFLGYRHYVGLVAENESLKAEKVSLVSALRTQKQTTRAAMDAIEEWKTSQAKLQARMKELLDVAEKAQRETRRLNEIFAKHNLEKLAIGKPGLIERRVNSGSDRILGLLGCATGDTNRYCTLSNREAAGEGHTTAP